MIGDKVVTRRVVHRRGSILAGAVWMAVISLLLFSVVGIPMFAAALYVQRASGRGVLDPRDVGGARASSGSERACPFSRWVCYCLSSLRTSAHLPQGGTGRVLDSSSASSSGWQSRWPRRFQPGRYVGLDLSDAMLEQARREFPGHSFIRGDMTDLPFADESFDGVVSLFGPMGHLPPQGQLKMIREVHRVLRPGGVRDLRGSGRVSRWRPGEDHGLPDHGCARHEDPGTERETACLPEGPVTTKGFRDTR